MIKGIVSLYDGTSTHVTIGTSEDVKAPRGLAALEKQGWVIDDDITISYKAWLALKRQGDVAQDVKYEDWVDNVESVDLRPQPKQLEQLVLMGQMTREQADGLLAVFEAEEGEAKGLPA